jgi:hypothetical protein
MLLSELLSQIGFFEFIRVEVGAKFMKHFTGRGASHRDRLYCRVAKLKMKRSAEDKKVVTPV